MNAALGSSHPVKDFTNTPQKRIVRDNQIKLLKEFLGKHNIETSTVVSLPDKNFSGTLNIFNEFNRIVLYESDIEKYKAQHNTYMSVFALRDVAGKSRYISTPVNAAEHTNLSTLDLDYTGHFKTNAPGVIEICKANSLQRNFTERVAILFTHDSRCQGESEIEQENLITDLKNKLSPYFSLMLVWNQKYADGQTMYSTLFLMVPKYSQALTGTEIGQWLNKIEKEKEDTTTQLNKEKQLTQIKNSFTKFLQAHQTVDHQLVKDLNQVALNWNIDLTAKPETLTKQRTRKNKRSHKTSFSNLCMQYFETHLEGTSREVYEFILQIRPNAKLATISKELSYLVGDGKLRTIPIDGKSVKYIKVN
jgi:hypothetical protein